jgi:hypothetical protein
MRNLGCAFAVVAAWAAASMPVVADVLPPPIPVELTASSDNSIWEESGALSNGAGTHLFAGNTSVGDARRALIRFDLTGLPEGLPAPPIQLFLDCELSPPGAGPVTFSLHRLTAEWGEAGSDAGDPGGIGAPADIGDATWTDRFFGQGQPWSVPGGEFVATPSSTATVGACPAIVEFDVTGQLVSDVYGWIQDPATNFGWIVIGEEDTPTTARRFASREGEADARPLLVVPIIPEAEPTPATGTWGALVLAAGLAAAATLSLLVRRRCC